MLSTLIRAGVIDYFAGVAERPLPEAKDRTFGYVRDAKREACIGIMRCFEQLLAKDIAFIKPDVFIVLQRLKRDPDQPLSVQFAANQALETWDRSLGSIRPR